MSVSVAAADAESGDQPAEGGGAQVVAVLDLSPREAEQVVNAATLGSLYLALSSVDGTAEKHTTPGVTPQDVVGANT